MPVEKLIFTGGLGRFQSGGDSCSMFITWLVRLTFPRRQKSFACSTSEKKRRCLSSLLRFDNGAPKTDRPSFVAALPRGHYGKEMTFQTLTLINYVHCIVAKCRMTEVATMRCLSGTCWVVGIDRMTSALKPILTPTRNPTRCCVLLETWLKGRGPVPSRVAEMKQCIDMPHFPFLANSCLDGNENVNIWTTWGNTHITGKYGKAQNYLWPQRAKCFGFFKKPSSVTGIDIQPKRKISIWLQLRRF
jgi:hypothetical protein